MGTNIPGFQTVKNNVIRPLIVATEKVVEYYFADNTAQGQLPDAVPSMAAGADPTSH